MVSVRSILAALGMLFTAYLVVRGLWWTGPVAHPWVIWATMALYLVVTWAWILWGAQRGDTIAVATPGRRRSRVPVWLRVAAVAAALIVPNAVMIGVAPESRTEPFATWVTGGIGALMTIVMARRAPVFAWVGLTLTFLSVSAWIGPIAALSLGTVGSVIWVAAAQLLVIALNRAEADTARLAGLQRTASAWQASQSSRQRERRLQVQRALQTAGPILGRTIETGGNLRPEERLEAMLAEGSMRDELRGPRLLDDAVRGELDAARRRGATVTLFDEGGLVNLSDDALATVRRELAEALHDAASTRLIIRTSPHEEIAITVVGRSGEGESLSDEDDVDLWREIRRP